MKKLKENDLAKAAILFLFFAAFAILLPSFNAADGLYNKFFDNYKIFWADGRTPSNFALIRNIITSHGISFPKGYIIYDKPVEANYDFWQIGTKFYPTFSYYSDYFFAFFLFAFRTLPDLTLYKAIVLLNVIFSSVIISIFYLIQRNLGLKPPFSFLSSMLAGIATSVLIYSKYLFINETLTTMFFMLFFYFILKTKKNSNKMNKVLLFLSFFAFLLFVPNVSVTVVAFLLFFYHIYKLKIYDKFFPLVVIILVAMLVAENYQKIEIFKGAQFFGDRGDEPPPISYTLRFYNYITVFNLYKTYIPALDYSIYGYNNLTSADKLTREYSYLYAFENKGNAIFATFYGLFAPLFSEKGFVYNSPFLIFSIFGLFSYFSNPKNEYKEFMIHTILFFLIIFGLLNFTWYGGVTPRYVRYFNVPILLLTFFAFYFIQHNTKNKLMLAVFLILAVFSILNVVSLAIREDWTYEVYGQLVSYDLVLWPFVPGSTVAPSVS